MNHDNPNGNDQPNDFHAIVSYQPSYLDTYVQVDTDPGFEVNTNDPGGFLDDEMWRTDGSPGSGYWEEAGFTQGTFNNSQNYFSGLFGAYNEPSTGYVQFAISTSPQNDPNTSYAHPYGPGIAIGVQTNNYNNVDIDYNDATYGTAPAQSTSSSDIDLGVESNSDYTGVSYEWSGNVGLKYPQFYNGNTATWTYWPSNGSGVTSFDDMPDEESYCDYVQSDSSEQPNVPDVQCESAGG